jgi:hypothetical protein
MLEEQTTMEQHIHTLSTGVRVRLGTVSLAAITDAQKRIQQPPVPRIMNQETGREEEDAEHPDYLAACELANMDRADAVMETLALFGIDLIDPLPEDGKWIRKLKLLEKRGRVDLGDFDLEDDVNLEFLYIKYVALSLPDWTQLFRSAGMEEGVVAEMMEAFAAGAGE